MFAEQANVIKKITAIIFLVMFFNFDSQKAIAALILKTLNDLSLCSSSDSWN